MNRIYYWLLVIRLSLRWINQPNLGDEVIYDGRHWRLNQGVRDPYWSLIRDGEYTVEDCWEGRQVMVLEHEIECQIAAGIRLPHQPEGSRHG